MQRDLLYWHVVRDRGLWREFSTNTLDLLHGVDASPTAALQFQGNHRQLLQPSSPVGGDREEKYMNKEEIRQQVVHFIRKNFIFEDATPVSETQSLLDTGVVDSTGILEMIGFLEKQYQIRFNDDELVAQNFDSVEGIESIVWRKLTSRPHPASLGGSL
jgi:acyl carrier protein